MFWIVSPVLVLVAILFVIVPMWRHNRRLNHDQTGQQQRQRDAANLAIFEERLGELQTEYDEGAFDDDQFESLKAELERSLLSDVSPGALEGVTGSDKAGSTNAGPPLTWRAPTRLIPLVLALLVIPPVSYVLYDWWGFGSDMEFAALVQRAQQVGADPEAGSEAIRDVIFDLGEVIEQDPENGWALYFMARQLTDIGQLDQARVFFRRAAEHVESDQDRAVILGQYAQIEYLASDREMTDTVRDIINRAQRISPNERSVLQLLGSHAYLNDDFQGAITYWQRLLSMGASQGDARFLQQAIADARQQLGAQGNGAATAAPQGPIVNVSVSLAPDVNLPPRTRVFVSAQAAGTDGPAGPPLAARALTVGDLPATVTLTTADAVGPRDLSTADAVSIVATASLGGTATVESGDWQGRVESVVLSGDEDSGDSDGPVRRDVELQIDTQVD